MENMAILEASNEKPAHIILPDLPNLEVETVGYIKFKVNNFKNLAEEGSGWHTNPIELCGRKWRVLFFPYGTKKCNDSVSVFLDYFSPKDQPRWAVCAQFSLDVICEDESQNIHRESQHRFNADETDWGFSQFYHQSHFYTEEKGRRYLVDNSITVEVCIRVLKDPTGILWHNFLNYDSKLETGYVGLKNQGATCYMNSLLQSLYFTSSFKKAVYQIPTKNEEPSKSIPLALQRVFFNLEQSERPAGTTELTKSFGWDSYESFMQHDVQEFNRVLCDKLENKMKGTPVEGAINRLFEGKMKSYVKCINVNYESSREEAYYDIQLNVKGMKNLEESFKDYIQVETLDGDNKYFAEGHGLQDARKGVIFLKFPPVLHLQLKRFEYDVMKDSMVKINDKHEFPDVIDLKQYMVNPEEQDAQIYHLHGVLVHSGDVHGGHYCAFIKPRKHGEWFKFDDDRVTRALPKEAMDENFGVDPSEAKETGFVSSRSRFSKKHTNAYMLVYIREADLDTVLEETTLSILPEETRSRFLEEMKLEDERRKEKEEQHLYVSLKIATEEIFEQHHFNDLCNFDPKAQGVPPISLKAKKQITFGDLKSLIAEKTRIKEASQRLWLIQKRQNGTYRPDEIINLTDNDKLEKLKECSRSNPELRIFVEQGKENGAGGYDFPPFDPDEDILLFIKSYEPNAKKLQYEFHVYLNKSQTPDDLLQKINERLKRDSTSTLKLFEEVRATIVEKLKTASFEKLQIGVGDIIIYQEDFEEVKENAHLLASSYFEYLLNRVQVTFRSRNDPKDNSQQFILELSKKMKYDEVAQIVGQKIGADPMMIQFVSHSVYSDGPKNEIKREEDHTLEKMLQYNPYINTSDILYYEKLDISITEMENKKRFTFTWITPSTKEKGPYKILVNQTGSFQELTLAIRERIKKETQETNSEAPKEGNKDVEMTDAEAPAGDVEISESEEPLRIYEVYSHKILKLIKETDSAKSISDYVSLYAEKIPKDQISIDENDQIIQIVHFHKDPYQLHGVPFYFLLKKGEIFSETLQRLNQKLEIPEKEWSKFKFGIISNGKVKYLSPEEDKDYVLCNYQFTSFEMFGLDHPDRNPKQSKWGDRAIVIRN